MLTPRDVAALRAAGLVEPCADDRALAAARAWIGTPYLRDQAARGAGADCLGLIRGVWADVTGKPAPEAPGRPVP